MAFGNLPQWQVVFAGLDVVVPLISPDLLAFPKLRRAYFELLAYMLEVRLHRRSDLSRSVPRGLFVNICSIVSHPPWYPQFSPKLAWK